MLDVIYGRTSYRGKYLEQCPPREDLIQIMRAGLSAPSGCNKQTTSLIAVDDPAQVQLIKRLLDPPVCETAPAFICVLTQRIIAYGDRCYSVNDYSAAIQNMLLAIKALGYESCWYEGHVTDEDQIGRRIADSLHVPADYDLVCVLPVGIAVEPVRHAQKKPFEQRAWFNGFKGNGQSF